MIFRHTHVFVLRSQEYKVSLPGFFLTGFFSLAVFRSFVILLSESQVNWCSGSSIKKNASNIWCTFYIVNATTFSTRGRSMSSCFCFQAFLCTRTRPPPAPLSLSLVYPGGGCSLPELSHQSKHKCMSCRPEATWFSLSPFVSLSVSQLFHHLDQTWGGCANLFKYIIIKPGSKCFKRVRLLCISSASAGTTYQNLHSGCLQKWINQSLHRSLH